MAETRRVQLVGLTAMMCVVFCVSCVSLADKHKPSPNAVEPHDNHGHHVLRSLGNYVDDQSPSAVLNLVHELVKSTKDPMVLQRLLETLESVDLMRESGLEGGEDEQCVSMTYRSSNCTMVLQLPDVTRAVTFLREAWQKGSLQFLGRVLRLVGVFNRPCSCSKAEVEPGCPVLLSKFKRLVDKVCMLP